MAMIVNLSPGAREEMGRLGRKKVEKVFDEKIVIGKYLEVISLITHHKNTALLT
jgi:hypothetical protein